MIQYDAHVILFVSSETAYSNAIWSPYFKESSAISIIDFITIQRHWKDLYSRPLNETHWRHLHEWNTDWVCSSWHQSIHTANIATFEIILFFEPEGKKLKENYILFKVNVVKIKLTISEKKMYWICFYQGKESGSGCSRSYFDLWLKILNYQTLPFYCPDIEPFIYKGTCFWFEFRLQIYGSLLSKYESLVLENLASCYLNMLSRR